MKYVMFDVAHVEDGLVQKIPVIFPNTLVHSMVAEAIKPMLRASFRGTSVEASSAGDVHFSMTDVMCGGKSETLGLDSNAVDAKIIAWNDYTFGLDF